VKNSLSVASLLLVVLMALAGWIESGFSTFGVIFGFLAGTVSSLLSILGIIPVLGTYFYLSAMPIVLIGLSEMLGLEMPLTSLLCIIVGLTLNILVTVAVFLLIAVTLLGRRK